MLKRAWIVLSVLWVAMFLGNGATKAAGIQGGDVLMAFIPPLAALACRYAVRWVVWGR